MSADLRKRLLKEKAAFKAPREIGDVSSWDKYYDKRQITPSGFCVYTAGEKGPTLLLLHGAGHTSLSWALVAARLKAKCRIVAFDMRGHGDTTVPVQGMSVENVVGDIKTVLSELYGEDIPPLILIGHSMGGAMAIHASLALPKGKVQALIVVDVVEGTAMAALPDMMKIVHARPQKFADLKSAIFWAVSNNIVRNVESASVSIPPQLREEDGEYYWKTDLEETSKYWKDWFTNMSNLFLSAPAIKLLMLAGVDRLDGPLTIAQMQGKFQMAVLPSVGHSIQEDAPDHCAKQITDFLTRFRILTQ